MYMSSSSSKRVTAVEILDYAEKVLNRESQTVLSRRSSAVNWKKEEEKNQKFPKLRRNSYCSTCVSQATKMKRTKKISEQRRLSCTTLDDGNSVRGRNQIGDEKPPTTVDFIWDKILPEEKQDGGPNRKSYLAQIFSKPEQPKLSDKMALKILQLGKAGDEEDLNTLKEDEVNASFKFLIQNLGDINKFFFFLVF